MKLKTPTVLLVGVAALLGLVAIAEIQGGDRDSSSGSAPLFSFAEEDIDALEIETAANTLNLERDDTDTWQLQEPEQAPVNDATVTFLLNLLATEESDRTFSVAAEDLDEYALDQPQATIAIELEDGSRHQLIIGNLDFSNEYLYAQVDPQPSSGGEAEAEVDVLMIPASFGSAVNRPLQDWIQLETDETGENSADEIPGVPGENLEPSPELNKSDSTTDETEN